MKSNIIELYEGRLHLPPLYSKDFVPCPLPGTPETNGSSPPSG